MEPFQLLSQSNSTTVEDALEAVRNISNVINKQEVKIWREAAIKRYGETEIEKLEEVSKEYDIQIEAMKSSPLCTNTKVMYDIVKYLSDQEILTLELYTITLNSKNYEIESRTRDIESWREKYKAIISDLKAEYEEKKAFYEIHNPAYKILRQTEIIQKLLIVEVKQLKAKVDSQKRASADLTEIREKIRNRTVVNFVKLVARQKQYNELKVKYQKAMERNKEFDQIKVLKVQEAPEKHSIDTQKGKKNFHSIMMQKIDFSTTFDNEANGSTEENCCFTKEPDQTNKDADVLLHKKIEQIKNLSIESNKIKVIENKAITLPSLESILSQYRSRINSKNRSIADSSFNESQSSQNNCSIQKEGRLSQELKRNQLHSKPNEMFNKQKIIEGNKNEVVDSTAALNTSTNISPEYLRNSISTSYVPQTISNQTPTKFSFGNRFSEGYQNQQKISMNKTSDLKRKMDSQNQDIDAATTLEKRVKSVKFASPIEERCPDVVPTDVQQVDIGTTLDQNISFSMNVSEGLSLMLEDSVQENYPEVLNEEFNFVYENPQIAEESNNEQVQVTSPPSMFYNIMNSRPTLGFSFQGGMFGNATTNWDIFK